jgi:hypothetical protein
MSLVHSKAKASSKRVQSGPASFAGSSQASRCEILQQLWIVANVLRRSLQRNPATIQYVGAVGDPEREIEMLFYDNNGDVFCEQDPSTSLSFRLLVGASRQPKYPNGKY